MNLKVIVAICVVRFLGGVGLPVTSDPLGDQDLVRLHGVVEDTAGKPISGVWVLDLRHWGGRVDTAADGSFRFEQSSRRLLFNHPLYAPEILLVRPGQPLPLKIILRARASVEWRLARCRGTRPGDPAHFKLLKLQIPRSFTRLYSKDADYDLVTVVDRRSKAELDFWRVASYSAGMPQFNWYEELVELRTRPIDVSGWEGFDVRGRTTDGRVSRWMGTHYTNVIYSKIPADVALKFDRIIDSACYY